MEGVSGLTDDTAATHAAQALLRVSSDALLDPQVLLEAVRAFDGRVVELVFTVNSTRRHVTTSGCPVRNCSVAGGGDHAGHHDDTAARLHPVRGNRRAADSRRLRLATTKSFAIPAAMTSAPAGRPQPPSS